VNQLADIVSFVGRSNSGKTTLLEGVIRELKVRGYRVGVVKHTCHHFDMDVPNKDTWRLSQAGGDVVAISSPEKMAIVEKRDAEISFEEIVAFFKDRVDIILTEGFKSGNAAKIEVSRSVQGNELLCSEDELLAIVSDQTFPVKVQQFDLSDAIGIAELLQERIKK